MSFAMQVLLPKGKPYTIYDKTGHFHFAKTGHYHVAATCPNAPMWNGPYKRKRMLSFRKIPASKRQINLTQFGFKV
jgi:hypothetical protein